MNISPRNIEKIIYETLLTNNIININDLITTEIKTGFKGTEGNFKENNTMTIEININGGQNIELSYM